MLEARGISKTFGPTVALSAVDFRVDEGEVVALVGENGSGKTTLMRILAGETQPDSGDMSLDGQPYRPAEPKDAHRSGVALIHQELAVCAHLDVAENLVLGNEPRRAWRVDRARMDAKSREVLSVLGHPDLDPSTPMRRLSPAVRQVVEIGRALAGDAKVVIFDEPTSSLTQADAERLFGVIAQLKAQGRAIVYISHFLDEVERVADRVTVLRDGVVVRDTPASETTRDGIIRDMVGREVGGLYPRSDRVPGEALLTLEAFAGASLTVHRGEVVGIAGLTGAGRTELIRAVFGLDRVRSGLVRVAETDGWRPPEARWRQGVGMVSEDRKEEGLALRMTIAENMALPRFARRRIIQPKREASRTAKWAQELRIRCRDVQQPVSALSGGNQQKVAIARLLDADADLLLLDEPTRGIDVGSKAEIYALIDGLAAQGKCVLMVSSYLPELFGVCDRIAVMSRGSLGEARPVAQTDAHRVMEEATR